MLEMEEYEMRTPCMKMEEYEMRTLYLKMEEYEMRTLYGVLQWIGSYLIYLFPFLGFISLILGILFSHSMFYVSALFTVSYLTAAFVCIKESVIVRYAYAIRGTSLLVECAFILMGFEFYELGVGLLLLLCLTWVIIGAFIQIFRPSLPYASTDKEWTIAHIV